MASIEQTAYPRFTNETLEENDLQKLFDPTDEEPNLLNDALENQVAI